MTVPRFITLEELARAHERLMEEVAALKREFEGHVHEYQGSLSGTKMTTETPKK